MSKSESALHRVPPYKRPIIIIGFLIILAIVIIATILICKNLNLDTNSSHLPGENNTSTSQPAGNDTPHADSDSPKPEDKAPAYEGESPNDLDELTGVIAYADVDPESEALHSAITINQYLHSDGQCIFNLKLNGSIYRTASATATSDITTSVCGPFTISIADLPPGTHQIEVLLTGDGKRGTITQDITL